MENKGLTVILLTKVFYRAKARHNAVRHTSTVRRLESA